jgi:hypothetical protein
MDITLSSKRAYQDNFNFIMKVRTTIPKEIIHIVRMMIQKYKPNKIFIGYTRTLFF